MRRIVRRRWALALGVIGIALGPGCGSTRDPSNATGGGAGAPACVPGVQIRCTCTNAADGAQTCKEDGSAFNPCVCSEPASGGRSGAGGGQSGGESGIHSVADAGMAGDVSADDAGAAGEAGASSTEPGHDFPDDPILEPGVPANVAELFNAAKDSLSSPLCVLEPQLSAGSVPGAMFPSNWLRPRFRVSATDVDLFQFRLHSPKESHDLVVYTTTKTWYLPKSIWSGNGSNVGLGAAAAGSAITVTIRALKSSEPTAAASVSGAFNVAPAVATGSILFATQTSWSLSPDSTRVLGFSVGDEGIEPVLKPSQMAWSGQLHEDGAELRGYYDLPKPPGLVDGAVRVMIQPTLTPDGRALVFTDDWPYSMALGQISAGPIGALPSYLGAGAIAQLKMPWLGSQSFSPAHWSAGDRVLLSSYGTTFKSGKARSKPWTSLPAYAGNDNATADDVIKWHRLAWFDLEAKFDVDMTTMGYGPPIEARNAAVAAARDKTWGLIETGDRNISDVAPSFNPAGDTIAYVATDYSPDSHPSELATVADVRVAPYNARQGGASQALEGASDPNYFEYEPTFSPDGQLIAFSRAKVGGPDGPFRNRFGELTVVAAKGGDPARLLANDPNACAGDSLPLTLLNGSPAWGPNPVHHDGVSYYFLVFTSIRKYGDEFSTPFQMVASGVTVTLRDSTQLYLTTIAVDDKTGRVTSYPAIYVWNQNRTLGPTGDAVGTQMANLTPVWGSTELAPIDIPPAK